MSKPYELRVLEYLKNFKEVAEKVKEIARTIDPKIKVFVFGSVIRGRYTALSDIDILIIVESLNKKYDIMAEVYKEIEAPIELHVITKELFEKWYKKFIDQNEMIEI